MKRLLLLCLVIASVQPVLAQLNDPKGYSKASAAYREYRFETTKPSFHRAKIRALIAKIKTVKKDDDSEINALPNKVFNALSTKEKFTYCMMLGEIDVQNCDGMPGFLNEEKQIFAYPADGFGTDSWSDRQKSFLHKNRSTVIGLLRATIKINHRVGSNLKVAIDELDTWELIPDMIAAFKPSRKDKDILSSLCLLMKNGKYKPFLSSTTYKKLYGDEDASFKSFVSGNVANQNLTISRATAYYKTRKG